MHITPPIQPLKGEYQEGTVSHFCLWYDSAWIQNPSLPTASSIFISLPLSLNPKLDPHPIYSQSGGESEAQASQQFPKGFSAPRLAFLQSCTISSCICSSECEG